MTVAQLTFWSALSVLSVVLTALFYPGVRRQAQSASNSLLAAGMAAVLCATGAALAASFVVNAIVQLRGA